MKQFIVIAISTTTPDDVSVFTAQGFRKVNVANVPPALVPVAAILNSSAACAVRDNAADNTLNRNVLINIVEVAS